MHDFLSDALGDPQRLGNVSEGEIHPRELDWVAIQRLRQAKLIEERPGRPGLTPARANSLIGAERSSAAFEGADC